MTHAYRGDDPDHRDHAQAALLVARHARARAAAEDDDGAFPAAGIDDLHEGGLLLAPFPPHAGGFALGSGDGGGLALHAVLSTIGRGSLALGRLYEGHVNAVLLVLRYGDGANLELLRGEALAGRMSGVWMAEADRPLRMERDQNGSTLRGRKVLCSGAGHVRRPLVAAARDGEASIMLLPALDDPARCDVTGWTASGMRATATGSVDFDGIRIGDGEIVGHGDDYLRSPAFRGGAWRVLAVQLGGLEALVEECRIQTIDHRREPDQTQRARFGEIMLGLETARLWVRESCLVVGRDGDADAIDAYVDLARNAFEMAAIRVIALVQKAIGLKAFLRPNPIERLVRDLTTYLRQPGLDLSMDAAARFYLGEASGDGIAADQS